MAIARKLLLGVVMLAVLVAGWQFAAANRSTIAVDYLFGQLPQLPVWQVLTATFLLGVLAAAAVLGIQLARLSLLARRYRRTVAGLEAEVHELRTLPLAPDGSAPDPEDDRMGLPRAAVARRGT
jgi:uncharacterized integral membrane protein